MTKTVDKITSYDFLGIFIPGSVGMAMCTAKCFRDPFCSTPISLCCGCEVPFENTTLMTTIELLMFFAGAYIIGLIINWLSDGFWRGFRNNDAFIGLQVQKLIQRNPTYRIISRDYYAELSATNIQSYASLYFKALIKMIRSIWYGWIEALHNKPLKPYGFIESQYYDAYYWLLERGKISSVSVIESQVTLLRNLLLPLCFGFPFLSCLNIDWWQLILFWLLVFFTMVSRQNRIYSLVLEDYQNYKEMEANK